MLSFSPLDSFRRRIHGPNIIEVPVKSYVRLLFEEVTFGQIILRPLLSLSTPDPALRFSPGSEPLLRVPGVQHRPVDRRQLLLLRRLHSVHLVCVHQRLAVRDAEGGRESRDFVHSSVVK